MQQGGRGRGSGNVVGKPMINNSNNNSNMPPPMPPGAAQFMGIVDGMMGGTMPMMTPDMLAGMMGMAMPGMMPMPGECSPLGLSPHCAPHTQHAPLYGFSVSS